MIFERRPRHVCLTLDRGLDADVARCFRRAKFNHVGSRARQPARRASVLGFVGGLDCAKR